MTPPRGPSVEGEAGYTLIELIVSMAIGMIVVLSAFTFLQFTTDDVARTTDRVHVTQNGRAGLEKLMLQLHSACVSPSVTPIQPGSSPEVLKFISEAGEKSALTSVHLYEVIYSEPAHTLTEKLYPSTSFINRSQEYLFSKTPERSFRLLSGVRPTEEVNKVKVPRPIFQYFRYYQKSEVEPKYGNLNETPIKGTLETEAQAETVSKVTVSFTVAPEGTESATFGRDRPVALEDSALFRLASPSEASGNPNLPCTPQT